MGQGTWHFAESPGRRADEIASIRVGIELGMRVIDTAEMYSSGASEELVGEAIAGRRRKYFLSARCSPTTPPAEVPCGLPGSLGRLGVDHLDLYLLHWRGSYPLAETIEGFAALRRRGLIRHWGVSNFDLGELIDCPAGGESRPDESGPLQPQPPRIGVRAATVVGAGRHAGHGLLADGAGPAARSPGAATDCAAAQRNSGTDRTGLGASTRRRQRHPTRRNTFPRSAKRRRPRHRADPRRPGRPRLGIPAAYPAAPARNAVNGHLEFWRPHDRLRLIPHGTRNGQP